MEVFLEKNITNDQIEKHKTRNTVFNVLRILALVWIVVGALIFMNVMPASASPLTIIFDILLIFIPPIFLFLLMTKLLADLNPEFDYHIEGTGIRIVKILNRKRRKIVIKTNFTSLVSIGAVDSDDFERAQAGAQKTIKAYCNEEAQLIYLLFNDDSEKILIVLEADFDLIVALKRSIMPVLYAESFKKLLNKVKIQ